jgi:hypothetical protein
MYNAKRDGYGNGANRAIPSMGEIEGRITVLEVVAMTSLSLLMKAGDKHAAHMALSAIRRAMRTKCEEIKLSSADADAAIAYAQDLFEATLKNTDREVAQTIASPVTKRAGTRRSIPVFHS